MTPMVDRVGGADYNAGETADSASLAWSSGNELPDIQDSPAAPGSRANPTPDDVDLDQSWTTAWTRAATVLLICLAVAVVIVVAGWLMHENTSGKAAEPARTMTAPVTTTAPATTTVSSTADQDSRYIAALNDKGIQFANPEGAVFNGKTVCQNIGQGMTVQEVVAQFRSSSPDFAVHAEDFVAISVRAYCPQYSKLVAAI